ncbi:DUF3087 family protein [Shewanella waksmanii]|uniref:DUF3087 family protein n=1 Tax=Shewanella waksmanii TaxID=213783 RepID=UPI00048BE63F|nr:DUF3087 family protein [Shewanella waksmanii]
MKLIAIDKACYRQRLNRVIAVFIAALAILSLVFGGLLISWFGQSAPVSGESTGNFQWNLLGVILAASLCGTVLYSLRNHEYLQEVYYVARLKSLHNRIYRQLKQWRQRAEQNDKQALIVLSFYYQSQKLVYLLDDNTLTLAKLEADLAAVEMQIAQLGLAVSADDFVEFMLVSPES